MTQQLESSKTVSKHFILILLNQIFIYLHLHGLFTNDLFNNL
jgi:hypothetical protein